MALKALLLLLAATLVQCLPYNLTSLGNSTDLQLQDEPDPPPVFYLQSLGFSTFRLGVAEAAHLMILGLMLPWNDKDPTVLRPIDVKINDSKFNLEYRVSVRRNPLSEFSRLLTVSKVAQQMIVLQMEAMRDYQSYWDFPLDGYEMESETRASFGECGIFPRGRNDEGNTFNISRRAEDTLDAGTEQNLTSVEALSNYRVALTAEGPPVPQKCLVWLFFQYLDFVLGTFAPQEAVKEHFQDGDYYMDKPCGPLLLKVTYQQTRFGAYNFRWSDIAYGVLDLFQKLNNMATWKRFRATISVDNASGPFLVFDVLNAPSVTQTSNATSSLPAVS